MRQRADNYWPKSLSCLKYHSDLDECNILLFTLACSCLICRDCIIYDHTGHKSEFVKKSAPRYKTILKQSLTPLAGIQICISSATREVEKVERRFLSSIRLLQAQFSSHSSNFMKSYTSIPGGRATPLSVPSGPLGPCHTPLGLIGAPWTTPRPPRLKWTAWDPATPPVRSNC